MHDLDPRGAIALWNLTSDLPPEQITAPELLVAKFHFSLGVQALRKDLAPEELIRLGEAANATLGDAVSTSAFRVQSHLAVAYLNYDLSQHGLSRAEQLLRSAIGIERQLGDVSAEAKDTGNLGMLMEKKGDWAGATACHRRSMEINKQTANARDWVLDMQGLARCCLKTGDIDGALRWAHDALRHYNEVLQMPVHRMTFCVGFAEELIREGKLDDADYFISSGLSETRTKFRGQDHESAADLNPHELRQLIHGMVLEGRIRFMRGDFIGAIGKFRRVVNMASVSRDWPLYFPASVELASILMRSHHNSEARKLLVGLRLQLASIATEDDVVGRLESVFREQIEQAEAELGNVP